MITQQQLSEVDWYSFNGNVVINSPLSFRPRPAYQNAIIRASKTPFRVLFSVKDGQFIQLNKGREKVFAYLEGDKLFKTFPGQLNQLATFTVGLMFPQLWQVWDVIRDSEVLDDERRQVLKADWGSVVRSKLDLTDWESSSGHFGSSSSACNAWLCDANVSDIRFVLQPKAET